MLFALILAAGWLQKAYTTYSDTSDFNHLVQLSNRTGAYMHEIQKERGLTGVFLGTHGASFKTQLAQQRKQTDTAVSTLKQHLKTHHQHAADNNPDPQLATLTQKMQLLEQHRAKVDNFSISTNQAVAFYTQQTDAMLNIITRAAKLANNLDSDIAYTAYESFLRGKERAGVERLIMSITFATGHFENNTLQQFASLVTEQDTYFNNFLELASPKHIAFYNQTLSKPILAEVQRMRNIAFDKGIERPKHHLSIHLLSKLGHGGLIHNFKNYLLRFNARDAQNFQNNYQQATQILRKLNELAVSKQETQAYATIQNMLEQYQGGIDKITTAYRQGKTTLQIDQLVKVNDQPALAAIEQLSESVWNEGFSVDVNHWFNTMTQKINLLQTIEDQLAADLTSSVSALRTKAFTSLILISLIATTLTLGVLTIVLIISKRILQPIAHLADAAKLIALGDLTQEIEDQTAGEIGDLAKSFNAMVQNLRCSFNELERANTQLEQLASTDKLTNLPNRAVFHDRLQNAITQTQRNNGKFAVLFFDFDRFKIVNDSLGHAIGDALLCDIADIFRDKLNETDTVARFGGDEFVVLLENLNEWSDAHHIAKKLLDAFATPHILNGHWVVSTASIGLVTNQFPYQNTDDIIRDADVALYQAKDNGKAQIVIFDQAMHTKALDRLLLEADLRLALDSNDFQLVYQPIIELDTGALTGFEALIRWSHPQRGIISPIQFIPIAEETGLIVDIGKWTLKTAAAQITQWNQKLPLPQRLTVNVNVSKRQLFHPSFLKDALQCQRDHNLKHGEVHLEITESIIADDRTNIIQLLKQLQQFGFPIVMDDFGTGVSSLGTLHEYPIDVLKIDQAFINVLDRNRSLLAVVASITNLADNLGIPVVAEGIETQNIVGALQSINCKWGQGYLFAKPMSPQDAEAYILKHYQQQDQATSSVSMK